MKNAFYYLKDYKNNKQNSILVWWYTVYNCETKIFEWYKFCIKLNVYCFRFFIVLISHIYQLWFFIWLLIYQILWWIFINVLTDCLKWCSMLRWMWELNWWKGKPSGSIACTRKQQPRFYWSCSSVVMNDATPLTTPSAWAELHFQI